VAIKWTTVGAMAASRDASLRRTHCRIVRWIIARNVCQPLRFFLRLRNKNRANARTRIHAYARTLDWRLDACVNAIRVGVNGANFFPFFHETKVESLRRAIMIEYRRRPSTRNMTICAARMHAHYHTHRDSACTRADRRFLQLTTSIAYKCPA